MEEVAATLKSMGIEPIMSEAAAKRLHWAANQGLAEIFAGVAPDNYHEGGKALNAKDGKSS